MRRARRRRRGIISVGCWLSSTPTSDPSRSSQASRRTTPGPHLGRRTRHSSPCSYARPDASASPRPRRSRADDGREGECARGRRTGAIAGAYFVGTRNAGAPFLARTGAQDDRPARPSEAAASLREARSPIRPVIFCPRDRGRGNKEQSKRGRSSSAICRWKKSKRASPADARPDAVVSEQIAASRSRPGPPVIADRPRRSPSPTGRSRSIWGRFRPPRLCRSPSKSLEDAPRLRQPPRTLQRGRRSGYRQPVKLPADVTATSASSTRRSASRARSTTRSSTRGLSQQTGPAKDHKTQTTSDDRRRHGGRCRSRTRSPSRRRSRARDLRATDATDRQACGHLGEHVGLAGARDGFPHRVSTQPGETTFTRIGASSSDSARASAPSAPFTAATTDPLAPGRSDAIPAVNVSDPPGPERGAPCFARSNAPRASSRRPSARPSDRAV